MLNRASEIQQICEERGINILCHFTRVENLDGILRQGLLGRSVLEERGQDFLFNDPDRVDEHRDAVCLSISFPNYLMFYSLRKEKEDEGVNDSQWAVLLLDPKVLWKFECAFCQENAAAGVIRETPLDKRKTPEALEKMFIGDYTDNRGCRNQRESLQIPDDYPTHPQAEALVFDPIPTQYITEVHFRDTDAINTARQKLESSNIDADKFVTCKKYFGPRCDYEPWKSDSDAGNNDAEP